MTCKRAYLVRNYNCTDKIWSPDIGYPCSSLYREFYRDIQEESPQVQELLRAYGIPVSGVSLYSVTDMNSECKKLYSKSEADEQIQKDTDDYIAYIAEELQKTEMITVCFDAELFGHWWKDGIRFLDKLLKKLPKEYNDTVCLKHIPELEPTLSTWGKDFNSDSWINQKTAHQWTDIIKSSFWVETAIKTGSISHDDLYDFVIKQASDWTFLITYDSFSDFSKSMISNPQQAGKDNILYKLIVDFY